MLLPSKFIELHATKFTLADLAGLELAEIALSGLERSGDYNIATDIPQEDAHVSQLNIFHNSSQGANVELYELDVSKITTSIVPILDGNDVDGVGYRYDGLMSPADARLWYRAKFGYEAAPDDAAAA